MRGFLRIVAGLMVVLGIAWVHVGRVGDAWYAGRAEVQLPLADAVAARALERGGQAGIGTGSARFDGEWDLATCQMTVLGLSQVIGAHPDTRSRYLPAIDACLDWLITEDARHFGTRAWGTDGMDPAEGTHAYMGYIALALGARRLLGDDPRYDGVHDRLSVALASGLEGPVHQLRTYPNETYPADQAAVIAAVALHQRTTGTDHHTVLADFLRRYRAVAVDARSGMLFQALSARSGDPVDAARGSGTALAAYFLRDADPQLSLDLYRSLGRTRVLGFGGVREYPPGAAGTGDVDSGPVVLGVSVSATGFGLAGARLHADPHSYRTTYRTAHLFGAPLRGWFTTGGGLGNAIMLAMLTAGEPA